MTKSRKQYSAKEKARIALEAIKGELTQSQLTAKYGVHSAQIQSWKKQSFGSGWILWNAHEEPTVSHSLASYDDFWCMTV